MRLLRTILAALAIAGLLAACGGNDNGWTERERDRLEQKIFSAPDFTADQAQCLVDYVVSHWSYYEASDASGHGGAHGREAGRACL